MNIFLRCVGEAVAAKGLRALAGLVPFGEHVYDIAAYAADRYRELHREAQIADIREDVEAMVQAPADDVRAQANQIAEQVLPNASGEARKRLELYLSQVPAVARQSLKRPDDPTGTSVPRHMNLLDPIQLGNLLPQRPPRFQAGEPVPDSPQWQLVDLLGAGGFGEVWLAKHTFLNQLRAVKFCLDQEARERLLQHEGEVVKHVMAASTDVEENQHGIVPLVDVWLAGETPWLAYEYIDGGDLSVVVRQHANRPPDKRGRRALSFLAALAGVIGRFHTLPRAIVHRDLKPANILIKKTKTGLLLRVTDFGISHVAAEQGIRRAAVSTPSLNLGETFRGAHTPIYASPQQKRGMKPDVRDDVHALGVIGWQLLLGDLQAERPAGRWRRRVEECQLSDDMLDLLESCWDDEADERPANAAVLAEELLGLLKPAKPTQARRLAAESPPQPVPQKPQPKPTTPPKAIHATSTPRIRTIADSNGIKFAHVPKGTFWMSEREKNAQKQVTIEQDFEIGVYPVTQGQWQAVMGGNPSWFSRSGNVSDEELAHFPVERVSWEDVQAFIKKLNEKVKNRDWRYRLPTEAEWEYACRGAATSKGECTFDFYFDKPTNELSSEQANFNGNHPCGKAKKGPYLERTTMVGSYEPNRLALYDMHGNVWEWCEGWDEEGSAHVIRGGCWYDYGRVCRAAVSGRDLPGGRNGSIGFRLARSSVK